MKILPKNKERGFALIEIIVFFIVIGVLVGIGVTFLAPLTKKEKRTESRDIVRAAKEAVLGFAVQYKRLPDTTEFAARFKNLDAWANTIFYYPDSSLTTENICYSSSTGFTVSDIGVNKTGTAFIILSKGENGANNTGETPTFTILQQSDTYDDIVVYNSISEFRNNVLACKELEIKTITLLDATEDTIYTTSLLSKGGSSPLWSVSVQTINTLGCSGNSYPLTNPNTADLCLYESTGIIAGTVNVSSGNPGTLTTCADTSTTFTATLSQTGLTSASKSFTITVNPQPLTITTQSLPDAKKEVPYSVPINGSGGKASYSWSVDGQTAGTFGCAAGNYPITSSDTGFCLNGTTGVLSANIPAAEATYNFTVQLADTCTTKKQGFILNVSVKCVSSGFIVGNQTGADSYFRRSGVGCILWYKNTSIYVYPEDVITVFNASDCTNERCTLQTLDWDFFMSYDANNNCYMGWRNNAKQTCLFGDS